VVWIHLSWLVSRSTPPFCHFSSSCYAARPNLHSFPTRRSSDLYHQACLHRFRHHLRRAAFHQAVERGVVAGSYQDRNVRPQLLRSEEHTSELQSRENLVCRLLLEKKKTRRV